MCRSISTKHKSPKPPTCHYIPPDMTCSGTSAAQNITTLYSIVLFSPFQFLPGSCRRILL